MYIYKNMLAVTNRRLCKKPFLEQIDSLAACHPKGIILREKDLSQEEYLLLAGQVMAICKKQGTTCILHTWISAARRLDCPNIHLPLRKFREIAKERKSFEKIGVSIHSPEEARAAAGLGADWLIAGHIFPTECKKGLAPRGLEYLRQICGKVSIPVYGIGGITEKNAPLVMEQGAAGYCVMSGIMAGPVTYPE